MNSRSTNPAAVDVDAAGIGAFLDAVEIDPSIEPHGIIVQRFGRRVAEGYWAPHDRGRARLVYSLSKSFTGVALGLMIDEGRLSLDDLVSDHLPEYFDGSRRRAHADAERLRIRHIASMSTGHTEETLGAALAVDPTDAIGGFLSLAAPEPPGSVFAYNQPPVLALAAILTRLAGESLTTYLRPRLLEPLDISTFRWAQWSPSLDVGFSGVFTDLDAVAKLGQLHLDRGRVDGSHLISSAWIDSASSTQTLNPEGETIDWQQGYGFQLWQSLHGYRGDGAFGQYMVVLPEHDAVVAMFSNTDQMQLVLDAMWQHLLPSFGRPGSQSADDALADRLATLRLPTTAERLGPTTSPANSTAFPTSGATFLPAPPTATSQRSITSVERQSRRLVIHEGEARLELPLSTEWSTSGNIAVSAAHDSGDITTIDIIFRNTPHRLELRLNGTTFRSDWGRQPLFGAGISDHLAAIRDST